MFLLSYNKRSVYSGVRAGLGYGILPSIFLGILTSKGLFWSSGGSTSLSGSCSKYYILVIGSLIG